MEIKLTDEMRYAIRETVIDTIREMKQEGMLRRFDDIAYAEIGGRLYDYYKDPERDPEMANALESIKGDEYFDILGQYYQQKITVDWIAEGRRCKYNTIARNKKRLCLKLYTILTHGGAQND